MTQEFVIDIAMEALKVTLLVSAPMLGFGLVTGIAISIFQAVTSIQEMTLTFIPKILAVVAALFIFFPWLLHTMLQFTSKVIIIIPQIVR